jgi:acetyltransferase
MKGNNLVILARSGGIAIIAADFAEKYRFRLFPFIQRFQNRIHNYFRAKVIQPTNPLDLGDLFDFDLYVKILEQVLKVRTVNGVLFHHGTTGVDKEPSRRLIQTIKDLSFRYQKPVALCYLADEEEQAFVKRSIDYPIFNEPEDGLGALAASRDYYSRQPMARRVFPRRSVKRSRVTQILQKAREEKRDLLLTEALDVIQAYGIPAAKGTMAQSISDVRRGMKKVGTPVALKIVSPQISHKSDVGGVRLNVDQPSEAEQAYRKMKNLSRGTFHGMLIQRMIPYGKEVILGVKHDPSFGPVLLFGLGGIYAEVLEDVSLRVAPIYRHEAEEMILESKAGRILEGLRGEEALDREAVIETLLRLSQLATDFPEIEGIDINPLKVLKKGAVALDARILIRKTGEE